MKVSKALHKIKHLIRFRRLQIAFAAFLALGFVLTAERANVRYQAYEARLEILESGAFAAGEQEARRPDSLLIYHNGNEVSAYIREEFSQVLDGMKISYDEADLAVSRELHPEHYDKISIALNDLSLLGDTIFDLLDWVRDGGSLLFLFPMDNNGSLQVVSGELGIRENSYEYTMVESLRFTSDIMLGGMDKEYRITDPFESSMTVILDEDCTVHMTAGGERALPLLWETGRGEGKIVVMNLGIIEKAYRGFYSAAYSLLGDSCLYPVINGSAFYLDDFPSPVPGGDSQYIQRDYGMDIATFYSNVWWPDVLSLAEDYGIRYTGVVIEDYSDLTEPPLVRYQDIYRFRYFGNQVLQNQGEIGFHGYNHMPLCLESFDYKGVYSYEKWPSVDAMLSSLTELNDFCASLFPDETFQVYVPPSNILSEEGRQMIGELFPQIRTIASIYFPGEFVYTQEFMVSEDGVIETPRIISGCMIDDYMEIAALSELNFHFINSHFQHPDDVLDPDRGAELGWETMFARLTEYVDWLYTAAPDIRNLTGSEMAAAVQRYYYVNPRVEHREEEMIITLDSFADEAWFFLRANDWEPGEVTGGSLTRLTGNLYLLQAEKQQVTIGKEGL
ncbi:MAG TPA: DUF2194 domain-containing protein [Candidatus Caccomorpha excrementavium]|nr:DUF2194 domain-containing protein [Candidatus Caccomorpha excrementavium]